jgi:hypothetical protein
MSVSDSKVDVPCPDCDRPITVRLRDISAGRTVSCPVGHRVKLVEEGDGIRQVDQAERKLNRTIDKLNRDLQRRR